MLLCATVVLSFSSCSKDDEENIFITKDQVIGTWDVTWAEQNGKSFDVPNGSIYITLTAKGNYKTVMFSSHYVGTYTLSGNTVVGTTPDPITEYYRFISLNGKNASIDYSNSVGDKYKFKAVKK